MHTIFEGTPDRKWYPDEKRECKMVFIGRELDAEAFKDAFEHCLVSQAILWNACVHACMHAPRCGMGAMGASGMKLGMRQALL